MTRESRQSSPRPGGITATARLLSAGLSTAEIRQLIRSGTLLPVRRGVYAHGLLADTAGDEPGHQLLSVAAALAITGPRAAGIHYTAAGIHSLSLLGRRPEGVVTVTRPPHDRGSRTGPKGVLVHLAELPPEHVTVHRDVRITSAARTVIDLARTSSFTEGVVVTDSALHAGKTTKAELEGVIAYCRRWPGVTGARQAVAFSDARSESVLESIARVVFHEHGLPAPDLQVWVGDDDVVIGRADFLWRRYRTIGEADGAIKYADPSRAAAQLERDASLRDAGYEVVHFSWHRLCGRRPRLLPRSRPRYSAAA